MAQNVHYYPILKGKRGEFSCLGELTDSCKTSFTPIIEVIPFTDNAYEKHLENKVIKPLSTKWNTSNAIFLDFHLLNSSSNVKVTQNTRPISYVFEKLRNIGMNVMPVTFLLSHTEYQEDVKQIINTDKRGFCLRLKDSDWMQPNLNDYINKLLNYLKTAPKDIDLVIDLKDILSTQTDLLSFTIINLINGTIPHIEEWRSLVIVGTSFPKNLSGIEKNTEDNTIPRVEWHIWNKLWNTRTTLKRMPFFGDYSVLHSELPDIDIKIMNRSAQIRYTIDNDWLVIKGRGVKQGGANQTHVLSRILVEKDEYSGFDFSWGDNHIYKCSRNEVGPGSPETWRKVENSHHITFVTHQLANYPGL